ncbi:hypothetical protein PN36_04860 [Candidatus Thiomargarita nelsonii]|uniref:Uncharacterized protein n=1 Tax=Candidatus Thiomargarita nelsonii TaxID=1003181 RepID=A0A4E0QRU9_9GAMM|nr:hypothetical protein PN36_04860 [Candidatus Thiomargarita nelsonii]
MRLETDKNQLIVELTQFEEQLKTKYPKYAQLSKVQTIGAKEGAPLLPADAVLISYLVNKNDVLARNSLTRKRLGKLPTVPLFFQKSKARHSTPIWKNATSKKESTQQ